MNPIGYLSTSRGADHEVLDREERTARRKFLVHGLERYLFQNVGSNVYLENKKRFDTLRRKGRKSVTDAMIAIALDHAKNAGEQPKTSIPAFEGLEELLLILATENAENEGNRAKLAKRRNTQRREKERASRKERELARRRDKEAARQALMVEKIRQQQEEKLRKSLGLDQLADTALAEELLLAIEEAQRDLHGYFYLKFWVVSAEEPWYKVGITNDLSRRDLEQNVLPVPATLLRSIDFGSIDKARVVEKAVLRVLEANRIKHASNRELFQLSGAQLSALLGVIDKIQSRISA